MANAVETDGTTAAGRATGSGKWGYVGQFGQLNRAAAATPGQFYLPYGLDIAGDRIAVTDSGNASWDSGSQSTGHTIQTFSIDAEPGSAGHGNYLGNGKYDIVTTKSSVADPADIVTPIGMDYRIPGNPRGPRGVAFMPDGTLRAGSYEATDPANRLLSYPADTLTAPAPIGGGGSFTTPGYGGNMVHIDSDDAGNTYAALGTSAGVYGPNGEFLSSVGSYFDQNGASQHARVTWGTRFATVPVVYADPDFIGEIYGLTVVDEGDTLSVFAGEAAGFYAPDPSVHFQNGATTAQGLNQASITKFTVQKSGGVVDPRWNPAGWKWTRDTSFGTNGRVIVPGANLFMFLGRPIFSGETVFSLEADATSNTLYYSKTGGGIVTLDMTTGAVKSGPATVNTTARQADSAQGNVRGIAADDNGLVYATTQNSPTTSNSRAIVQIFGMTPTSIAGTASAATTPTSATLAWAESVQGYQQTELLDYVVKYRVKGATTWTTLPATNGGAPAATSVEETRQLTGLQSEVTYEAMITPWNEAGSGDPALIEFTTPAPDPQLTLTKKGNDALAPTAADAVIVAADSTVTFSYEITNSGNVPLTGVALTDDKLGTISDPSFDGTLDVDESVTLIATGPVAAGAYVNIATATSAAAPDATDEWHGFGATTGLTIVKKGAAEVATTEAGAIHVPAGSVVDFEYEVTNVGNVPASDIAVSDDKIGALTPPADFSGVLAPNGSVTFTASGPVPAGAYVNTATATSADAEATTEWHGFGDDYALSVVKLGNGEEAPTAADAIRVAAGLATTFTYVVTNDSNVAITGVAVADDQLGAIAAPAGFEGKLEAGESITFSATGVVPAGEYVNVATASSVETADATAEWHGFGAAPEMTVTKTGNGDLALTAAEAVHVPAGSDVEFAYTVTNTGNTTLTGVTVTDDQIATVTPPNGFDGTLAPGASVTFTATGVVGSGAYVNVATATAGGAMATAEWHGVGDVSTPTPTPTETSPTPTPTETTPAPSPTETTPAPTPTDTTPAPTDPAPTATAPGTPPTSPTPTLPATGSDGSAASLFALFAVGLLGIGAVLYGARRRRAS